LSLSLSVPTLAAELVRKYAIALVLPFGAVTDLPFCFNFSRIQNMNVPYGPVFVNKNRVLTQRAASQASGFSMLAQFNSEAPLIFERGL
jgi:hypothetical protein